MKRSIPLSLRIIGISILLVTASLAVMTVILSDQIKNGVTLSQEDNLTQAVTLASKFQGSIIANLKDQATGLAGALSVTGSASLNTSEALSLLKDAQAQSPFITQIFIVDDRQNPLVSTPGPVQKGFSQAFLLSDTLSRLAGTPEGTVAVGTAVRPVENGAIYITLVQEFNAGKDGRDILVTVVDLDKIFEMTVRDQVYGKEGYAFIGDTVGRLLSHPKTPFKDVKSEIFMVGILKAISEGKKNQIVAYPWEGRAKHLSFTMIPGTNLFVSATVYDADLFSLATQITTTLLIIGAITLILITVVLSFSIMLFVTQPLGKITASLSSNAGYLESASQQISASSEQLSSGSSELAASVEEISASLEELESVVELNTKNINESELLMRDTNEGSQRVSERMEVLSGALAEIATSSSEIVNIIMVIEDIAFQTNILALNAAVEAGRAGEAGRGFSVVADQVKDLAQKSSAAAKETSKLIQKALKSIERGETLGTEVKEIQNKAAHMTNQVSTLLDEVNRASQEQMKGIKQISIAVSQTNSVVQQTASSAEETASASEELYGQAEELNSAVGILSTMVTGRAEVRKTQSSRDTETPRPRRLAQAQKSSSGDAPVTGITPVRRQISRKEAAVDPDAIIPMNDEFTDF